MQPEIPAENLETGTNSMVEKLPKISDYHARLSSFPEFGKRLFY